MKNKPWFNMVFMLICTVICTGLLSGVYVYSRPLIQANARMSEIKAHLNALNISLPDSDPTELESFYDKNIVEQDIGGITVYQYQDDKEGLLYALPFEGSGLWGKITGVVALDGDLKTVVGIDFITQNETPGLGGRIEETWFKEQFRGITLYETGNLIRFTSSGSDGQVDAIAGATITSASVANMINESISQAKSKVGGGS